MQSKMDIENEKVLYKQTMLNNQKQFKYFENLKI